MTSQGDLLTCKIPFSERPGSDQMSKFVLKHPDVKNIITRTLMDTSGDAYRIGDAEWDHGLRSDVLYEPMHVSLDQPPIIVEVQAMSIKRETELLDTIISVCNIGIQHYERILNTAERMQYDSPSLQEEAVSGIQKLQQVKRRFEEVDTEEPSNDTTIATTIEVKQKEENHVKDLFKKVLRDGVKYEHVNGLKLDTQPMLFDNHSILVTNFDLFWHNQPSHDDSAFGLDVSDFYTTPVCKIIDGWRLCFTGGNLVPFLGSSLGNFEFQDESTCEMLIPTAQQPYMNTERLLDQYFKNCLYKFWGYHCLHSYLKKFMPIIPVHFYGHASQKHKAFNIYHFVSELLYVLCSKQAITKNRMAEMWLSFTRTTFYEKAVNGAYIVNFQEMKNYLDGQKAKNVYVKLLVKVAIEMEAKCPNYPAGIFGLDNGRKNALDIMMNGLKETIRKQNVANVMTRKKELRL
ncbi:hypothetical protein G6F42_007666 [Rhizopus arrhizus]|nr:hypothetical protein G6F42_007666 [Rhizopus arrhizus]